MKSDELGAVSAARWLFDSGCRDDEVIAELRERYVLDDHVMQAVLRQALALSVNRNMARGRARP